MAVVDAVRTALGDASVDALDGCDCESDVLAVGAATGVGGGVGGVVEFADAPPDADVVLVVLVLAAPASVVGWTVLTVSSDDDDVL